jgi:hypothetical protein
MRRMRADLARRTVRRPVLSASADESAEADAVAVERVGLSPRRARIAERCHARRRHGAMCAVEQVEQPRPALIDLQLQRRTNPTCVLLEYYRTLEYGRGRAGATALRHSWSTRDGVAVPADLLEYSRRGGRACGPTGVLTTG